MSLCVYVREKVKFDEGKPKSFERPRNVPLDLKGMNKFVLSQGKGKA